MLFKRSVGSLEGSLGFHLGCHFRFHLGFYSGLHLGFYYLGCHLGFFRVSFKVFFRFHVGSLIGISYQGSKRSNGFLHLRFL